MEEINGRIDRIIIRRPSWYKGTEKKEESSLQLFENFIAFFTKQNQELYIH